MSKRALDKLKSWAKQLKSEIYTLYVAMRDPRTPVYARYFALLVIGYALSPIDLIPDFIPVLGLLDDLILLPIGIVLLRRMIPPVVMAASRRQAQALIRSGLPASQNAAMVVMAIWALVLTACIWWVIKGLLNPGTVNVTNPATFSTEQIQQQAPGDSSQTVREIDRGRSRDR